jgi:hypothetical protein
MLRRLVCGLAALVLMTGILIAEEVKAKFKSYEKGSLTVTVKGKEQTFKLDKQTKVFNGDDEVKGKEKGKLFKELDEKAEVTVTFDKDGEKTTVKEVKIKK